MPHVNYLFITTEGMASIPDPAFLEAPLVISLNENHAVLTLKDYFAAMESFLLSDNLEPFCNAAARAAACSEPLSPEDIESVTLCSIKVGAYYHITRVDVSIPKGMTSLALSAAFTPEGQECLRNDYETLVYLRTRTAGAFLPEQHFCGEVKVKGSSFFMMLGEWLEGFHEWHFSTMEHDRLGIVLWDGCKGHGFLQPAQEEELFFKIAQVLTLCFEPSTGKQVRKWHHAAGDFIARLGRDGSIDVRLTTIRGYTSLLDEEGQSDTLFGLLLFFLDLTIRTRLDRLDGIGMPIWVSSRFLRHTVKGFFAGLSGLQREKLISGSEIDAFQALLKTMSMREIHSVLLALLDVFSKEEISNLELKAINLEEHADNLYKVLQGV